MRTKAGARRYLDLYVTLVERELRTRGKRSVLGTIWPAIAPLFLMFLYLFVFKTVFDIGIERYPVYLLCGLLPWTFLVQALGKSIQSLSSQPEMMRKAPMPYELLPLGTAGGLAINFLMTLGLFMGYLAATGDLAFSLLPVLVLPVAAVIILVMALSMLVALIDVYTTDLRLILGNILTLWFFLVPIVYRPDMAPGSMQFLRSIDPMSLIVSQFRGVLYYQDIRQPEDHLLMLGITLAVYLAALGIFRKIAPGLPKDV